MSYFHTFNQSSDYARLFLDLPFQHGISHIKVGMGLADKKGISEHIQIQTEEPKKLDGKERFHHIMLGISECIPIIGIIVTYVAEYFKRKTHLTSDKLIRSEKSIPLHQSAWYQNLGLLRSPYDHASGKQREKIQFLAANYLNNVTPKKLIDNAKKNEESDPDYLNQHQGTPLEEYSYHRMLIGEKIEYGKKFNKNLALGEKSLFILTDTTEVNPLFTLNFSLIDEATPSQDYASIIKQTLTDHFALKKKKFNQHLDFPILLDVTHLLGGKIVTMGQDKKEKEFQIHFETIKSEFFQAQSQAIQAFLVDHPEFSKSKLEKFITDNSTCISRVSIDGTTGIKMLPLDNSNTRPNKYHPFINFVITTGIFKGAINLRRLTSNLFNQRPDVSYAVTKGEKSKSPILYYPEKKDFIQTCLFNRLLSLFGSSPVSLNCGINQAHLDKRIDAIAQKPHMKVLGKATMDLLNGLMSEISQQKWDEINKDPVYANIFQASLFKIREHLAAAEQHALIDDFNAFSQEIEIVHSELGILLELTQPYQEKDFSDIYKKELIGKSVPIELKDCVRPGLGKTAVNIFAGIASAIKGKNPSLEALTIDGAYFEEVPWTNHVYEKYIQDPTAPKVGLFLCHFSPNVDIGTQFSEYKECDVAAKVKKLLKNDRVQEKFTVAVDMTIDEFHSDKAKNLLDQFKDEIQAGKINFAFFSSGQKFQTLGMDNYYGSYFYLVNNGDEKWKNFDSLYTHPVHRTDTLSTQWFCLATKYAADSLNQYRKLIFNNTRYVLDHIPQFLQPNQGNSQAFKVNRASPKMDASFIDLKAMGHGGIQKEKCQALEKHYAKFMRKNKLKHYSRGSFGFFHQNFSIFNYLDVKGRTIRINPGINPEENDKLIGFLSTLNKI